MTDIIIILDESGSMEVMGNEPIQAMNLFINKQKELEGVSPVATPILKIGGLIIPIKVRPKIA